MIDPTAQNNQNTQPSSYVDDYQPPVQQSAPISSPFARPSWLPTRGAVSAQAAVEPTVAEPAQRFAAPTQRPTLAQRFSRSPRPQTGGTDATVVAPAPQMQKTRPSLAPLPTRRRFSDSSAQQPTSQTRFGGTNVSMKSGSRFSNFPPQSQSFVQTPPTPAPRNAQNAQPTISREQAEKTADDILKELEALAQETKAAQTQNSAPVSAPAPLMESTGEQAKSPLDELEELLQEVADEQQTARAQVVAETPEPTVAPQEATQKSSSQDALAELEQLLKETEQIEADRKREKMSQLKDQVDEENKSRQEAKKPTSRFATAPRPSRPAQPSQSSQQVQPSSSAPVQTTGQSERLEDQNIFFLLGAQASTDQEKNQFLDELQQVIWEDFVENDTKILLTDAEYQKFQDMMGQSFPNDQEKQEALATYLQSYLPDMEQFLLDKALTLKGDMVRERILGMREFFVGAADKLAQLDQADQLVASQQWRAAASLLNQMQP